MMIALIVKYITFRINNKYRTNTMKNITISILFFAVLSIIGLHLKQERHFKYIQRVHHNLKLECITSYSDRCYLDEKMDSIGGFVRNHELVIRKVRR